MSHESKKLRLSYERNCKLKSQSTFEDLVIIHYGSFSSPSFIAQFKETLLERIKSELVLWEFQQRTFFNRQSAYEHEKSGKIVQKLLDGTHQLHSCSPLPQNRITYFQLRINTLPTTYGGIFFGVSREKTNTRWADVLTAGNTIVVYNSTYTSLEKEPVVINAGIGDVIGVVVDLDKDQVRFYVNGKMGAVGKNQPSLLQPLYAVLSLANQGTEIEMGDFYSYHALVNQ